MVILKEVFIICVLFIVLVGVFMASIAFDKNKEQAYINKIRTQQLIIDKLVQDYANKECGNDHKCHEIIKRMYTGK